MLRYCDYCQVLICHFVVQIISRVNSASTTPMSSARYSARCMSARDGNGAVSHRLAPTSSRLALTSRSHSEQTEEQLEHQHAEVLAQLDAAPVTSSGAGQDQQRSQADDVALKGTLAAMRWLSLQSNSADGQSPVATPSYLSGAANQASDGTPSNSTPALVKVPSRNRIAACAIDTSSKPLQHPCPRPPAGPKPPNQKQPGDQRRPANVPVLMFKAAQSEAAQPGSPASTANASKASGHVPQPTSHLSSSHSTAEEPTLAQPKQRPFIPHLGHKLGALHKTASGAMPPAMRSDAVSSQDMTPPSALHQTAAVRDQQKSQLGQANTGKDEGSGSDDTSKSPPALDTLKLGCKFH